MATRKAKLPIRGWKVLPVTLLTLLAAEALGLLVISPLMTTHPGAIVLAGLFVLPLWATLLTLVCTAHRPRRFLLILTGLTILSLGWLSLATGSP